MTEQDTLELPVEIAFVRMESSDRLAHQVRKQARKLERFRDYIVHLRVALEADHKGGSKAQLKVKVEASVPGRTIVAQRAGRPHHAVDNADAYGIIRESFDAAMRQVDAYVSKQFKPKKGDETPRNAARIVQLDSEARTGVLESDTGQSIPFDSSAVAGDTFATLEVGMEVVYALAGGDAEGPRRAASVTRAALIESHGRSDD